MRRLRHVLPALIALASSACVFSRLGDDLTRMQHQVHLFTGEVTSEVLEFHPTVIVALDDPMAGVIVSFRMLSGEGVFEIRQPKQPAWFFAFADLNRDLRFQADEPFGWAGNGNAVEPEGNATRDVDIVIGAPAERSYPPHLVEEPLENHLNNYARTHIGTVTALENPLFSSLQGRKGHWQPFAFWEDGGAGLHFLEPYDAAKIPVLFVHGINGSPQDFRAMIERLDKARYQPWVVSYPSGMRLSWIARALFQFIEVLHREHDFSELHLIAHSMGGLVARGTLNLCRDNRSCGYVASFTTLSTPWDGVSAAQSGVRWAPTVVPVWNDLDPASEYLSSLFDEALPDRVPHHLLFGFRQESVLATGSGDGVIRLSSQLRPAAQEQAATIRGYDADHAGILKSEPVVRDVFARLDAASAGRR